jgi:hypothetical protein
MVHSIHCIVRTISKVHKNLKKLTGKELLYLKGYSPVHTFNILPSIKETAIILHSTRQEGNENLKIITSFVQRK